MPGKHEKTSSNATAYFDALPSPQKEIAARLRHLLQAHFPSLSEGFKTRVPVYSLDDNPLFSIEAYPRHVNFKLFKGASLHDPYYLLEGSGKGVRYLTFHAPEDIIEEYIRQLVAQSIDRDLLR